MKAIWDLLKTTFDEWKDDHASRLAAALSYYTVFSLAPLLVIIISIVGLILGQARVQQAIINQLQSTLGSSSAGLIQTMIAHRGAPAAGIVATGIGVVTLVFGALGVFNQLRDSLNIMWEVEPKSGRGIWGAIKQDVLSFAMILGVGFLLLVSLVLSAGLSAVSGAIQGMLPGGDLLAQGVNIVVSFIVITLLFAMIYKLLPDAKIAWRDVWIGAAITAVLFVIGKQLIGLYLGHSSTASAYGAAGSLIIILLWVYYSAQILFFGAEFTQVYSRKYGSRIAPAPDAVPLTERERANQGVPRSQAVDKASQGQAPSVEAAGESIPDGRQPGGRQPADRAKQPAGQLAGQAASIRPAPAPRPRPALLGAVVFAVLTVSGVAMGIIKGGRSDHS